MRKLESRVSICKRSAGKPPKFYNNTIEDKYLIEKYNRHKNTELVIEPTVNNFCGTEKNNPVVCSHFSCNTHLTPTNLLFGTTCIHHQKQKPIDVAKYASHPAKKTA